MEQGERGESVTSDRSLGQVWDLIIVILRFIINKDPSKMLYMTGVKTNIFTQMSCRAKKTHRRCMMTSRTR